MMAVQVTVKNSGNGLKTLKQHAKGASLVAVAGVFKNAENSETGESVAKYAKVMEYGSPTVPPRPFMRQTVKAHDDEWKAQLREGLRARGFDKAREVLVAVGRLMRGDIIATIRGGSFKRLAPATIRAKERKGRPEPATPLIDTTSLIKSISSEVRKR